MKKRRLLAGILAFAMAFTSISYTAFADEGAAESEAAAIADESAVETEADAIADESAAESEVDAIADDVTSGSVAIAAVDEEASGQDAAGNIVVQGDWQGTIYGNSCTNDNFELNSIQMTSDDSATLSAKKGKISGSQDGIVFLYQQISADEDFVLSATANVESYTKNNQVAFGLRMGNQIFEPNTDPGDGNYGSSFAAGAFRLENKPAIGAYGYYRADNGTLVSSNNASTYTVDGTALTAEDYTINEGDTIDMRMKYNATLKVLTITVDGVTREFSLNSLEAPATFADDIYVGPFVSREAVVNFTNISLITGAPVYEEGAWIEGYSAGKNQDHYLNPTMGADGKPTSVSMGYNNEGKGKLTDSSEQYRYYVTPIDSNANFTMSAKVKIDGFGDVAKNGNQTGFGIVLRSTIDTNDSSYTGTVDGNTTDDNLHSASIMLDFIPAEKKVGDPAVDMQGASLRLVDKKMAKAAKAVPEFSNVMSKTLSADDEYEISVTKSGTAYSFKVKDSAGNEYNGAISDRVVFGNTMYPGFFVARNAKVTYSDIKFEVDNRVVEDLNIAVPSNHLEYYYGEKFVADGLQVRASFYDPKTDTRSEDILADGDYIATAQTNLIGDSTVTIGKGSVTITYPITVRKMRVTSVDITQTPYINRYYEYQTFTSAGLSATATFEDGSTADLDLLTVDEPNSMYLVDGVQVDSTTFWTSKDAGAKTGGVTFAETDTITPYGADGKPVAGEFPLTISPYKLESISVTHRPDKVDYVVGEDLDITGLIVTGTYTDGKSYAFDVVGASTYHVEDFDSSKIGSAYEATVVMNEDPSKTDTFRYNITLLSLNSAVISHYGRTSYPTGTALEEIEQAILSDTVITKTYSNNSTEELKNAVVTAEDGSQSYDTSAFSVDLSAVDPNTNGTYTVKLVPADPEIADYNFEFDITIWGDKVFKWNSNVFGASSGKSTVVTEGNVDENGFAEGVHITSFNGDGKVTNSGHDGIAYYYTRVNPDNNFTITGDVEVIGYHQNNGTNAGRMGQEGFGIMARDVIPLKPKDGYSETSDGFEGLGTEVVVQTDNAAKSADGEPIPLKSGADFYSNIVTAGGYAWESYGLTSVPATARQIERANSNRMKMFVRSGVGAWNGSNQPTLLSEELVADNGTSYGDYMRTDEQLLSGECFYPKKGDVYRISLSRINKGYYMSATVLAVGEGNAQYADRVIGRTFTYAYDYTLSNLIDDPLIQQNSDTIYVGFYAARYAEINVTNMNIYESDPATDYNTAGAADEVESASISVTSALYTDETNYDLRVSAGNTSGGTAIIKITDKATGEERVVANGAFIGKQGVEFPVKLEVNKEYDLLVSYTPSQRDLLQDYSTITTHYDLFCVESVEIEGDTIYVAPEEGMGESTSHPGVHGSFKNKGTIDSPLNIDSAITAVEQGQTIVLLDGTYYIDDTVTIPDSNFGYINAYKTLTAESPRGVTLDFMRKGSGVRANGDYWHIKDIIITKTAIGSSYGMNLTGSGCIVENCVFGDCGGTGFQLSGNSSETFDNWPSNNLIVYCESYDSLDNSGSNADGFGCKLTVGNGNIFKNCVSHNNNDDGWDLYTKTSSGPIGAVVIEDCISYDCSYYLVTENNQGNLYNGQEGTDDLSTAKSVVYNTLNPKDFTAGDKVLYQAPSSSGNGFKLGGESVYVQHYIKDSVAWGNKAKGIDSNSNPAMKVRNCVSYHNGIFAESVSAGRQAWTITTKDPGAASNFGLQSGVTDKVYNYNIDGAISIGGVQRDRIDGWNGEGFNQAEDGGELARLADIEVNRNTSREPALTLHAGVDPVYVTSPTNWLVKDDKEAEKVDWGNLRSGVKGGTYVANGYAGYNSEGEKVTPDWFVSVNETDAVNDLGFISQNPDKSYNLNGFLQLTEKHQYKYNPIDVPNYNSAYRKFFGLEEPTQPDGPGGSGSGSGSGSGGSSGGGGGSHGSGSGSSNSSNNAVVPGTTNEPDSEASSGNTTDSGNTGATTPAETGKFTDISSRPWAVDAINRLADLGIISGITSTTFGPDLNLTRADFAVLISRVLDLKATKAADFGDVSATAYYADAVAALAETGIVSGYADGTFKPSQSLTRQEMFVLVAKVYEYIGADITADTAVLDKFSDTADVAAWAAPYAAYLVSQGVVNGTEGKLDPNTAITRAQAAVLLNGVYDNVMEVFAEADAEAASLEAESAESETASAEAEEATEETSEAVSETVSEDASAAEEEASEATTEEASEAATVEESSEATA